MPTRLRIPFAAIFVFLSGCSSLKLDLTDSPATWSTFGANVERQNAAASPAIDQALDQIWVYNSAAGFGSVSPLIAGNHVLVGNRKGEIHAIHVESGKRAGTRRFGESMDGTPVINSSTLFLPIGVHSRRGLRAYDLRTGEFRWNRSIDAVETGLLLVDEYLIVVDSESNIRKVDSATGEDIWSVDQVTAERIKTTPVSDGKRIAFLSTVEGSIIAVSTEDGSTVYETSIGLPTYTTLAHADGRLLIPTTRGVFVCLDAASGREMWRLDTQNVTVRFSSPAVAGDTVTFGGTDGTVRRLDVRTGRVLWEQALREAIAAPPLVVADRVLIGTLAKGLHLLDAEDGRLLWTTELKGRVKSAMAASEDGIFVLSEPRFVYRFMPSDEVTHAALR